MGDAPRRPLILATNDDGFEAAGLAALAHALATLGEVVIVAPEREQSGAGHALTLRRPLRVRERAPACYSVDGMPTDCVHLGVYNITGGRLPDLVVSGINRGLNLGDDVTYSGTVAGALEGTLLGVPSLAFSAAVDERGEAEFSQAARYARSLASLVLERGLPAGVFLSVNVPLGHPKGVRIARQGTRVYRAAAVERTDPSGRPYYWLAGPDVRPAGEPDGDHAAVAAGFVAVTPLQANLTHFPSFEALASWLPGLE